MKKTSLPTKQKVKKARKLIKFWINVLFETELMNEKIDRCEVMQAFATIKQHSKIKSGT